MTRITPRTCLWPLAGSLVFMFALSIGLTFRSNHHCYAGTCGEWLFPLQARLHVVVWYSWLAVTITILAIRAFQPGLRNIIRKPVIQPKIPVLDKQLGVGGLLLFLWVLALYTIIVGIWWSRLRDYFMLRGIQGGVLNGNERLAAVALTGHLCDVTMGMAIIPISRHSALGSFFKISVATSLTFHMITAYTLFALVITHGFVYIAWIPVFKSLSTQLRRIYPVLNPTYLYEETWPGSRSSLGIWRASLIFTGTFAALIMLLIFITTLPSIRKRHFNLFYFTHLVGIVAIVIICLHASTMLYCTAPGLIMWLLDWLMRLYELWVPLNGSIKAVGKGWYRVSVPLPRRRLDGCACTSPLAHFYIHHSDSSKRELHPFTTTTHLASQNRTTHVKEDTIEIEFLFRKQGSDPSSRSDEMLGLKHSFSNMLWKLRTQHSQTEWTNKLAGCVEEMGHSRSSDLNLAKNHHGQLSTKPREADISLRLEGPYFTIANPAAYNTVICLVAGTGISGGLAIVGAFKELERQSASSATLPQNRCLINDKSTTLGNNKKCLSSPVKKSHSDGRLSYPSCIWTRCIVVWAVREDAHIELPELSTTNSNLEVQVYLTGPRRNRLSPGAVLDSILDTNNNISMSAPNCSPTAPHSTWVYISGPNGFIEAGEVACKARQHRGLDWYGARWDI